MQSNKILIASDRMQVLPLDKSADYSFTDQEHPTRISILADTSSELSEDATHFAIVHSGSFLASIGECRYELKAGCFASVAGAFRLQGNGRALVLSALRYRGVNLIGGPVEANGRLRYIDGCTSSILIAPPIRGEPCLNFLHLPSHTSQTLHTHPTLRAGLIFSGNGKCETRHGMLNFAAGTVFLIPPHIEHSFQSYGESMRIVIYHPDSDSGPTHEDHTMLNRTFVNRQSARQMTDLHTRKEAQN